jgi:hypothetical protein
MSTRFKKFLLISIKLNVLICLIISVIAYGRSWPFNIDNFRFTFSAKHRPVVRMAIINSVAYHSEVWHSYIYAAALRLHWHISLFTVALPHNIQNENDFSYITRKWSQLPFYTQQQHVNHLLTSTSKICWHQIIVIATLEISYLQNILDVLVNNCDRRSAYLVLVQLHQAADNLRLLNHFFKQFPWLLSQKRIEVRLLALAPHVRKYAEQYMKKPLHVDVWMPVFPIDLPSGHDNEQHQQYFNFIIQGNLQSHRRNYSGFLTEVERQTKALNKHRIAFSIVGRSKYDKNDQALQSSHVRYFTGSHYIPADIYYSLIHRSAGIIPLFSRDTYYNGTQSSSIRTSFLTRTPLLSSQRLLETHKHIPKETVWFKYDNETDVDAILRTVTSYPSRAAFRKALSEKRQRIDRLVQTFYMNNEHILRSYAKSLKQRTE